MLHQKGFNVTVFEMGPSVGSNINLWKDVTLFSPDNLNVSNAGREVLLAANLPPVSCNHFSSGAEFISSYLQPIENFLSRSGTCTFQYNTVVVSISKLGLTKNSLIDNRAARAAVKFTVLAVTKTLDYADKESYYQFDAIIDATGTYNQPNFAGPGGMPAIGETKLRQYSKISYYIADPKLISFVRVSKPVVAVIGSGTSAISSLKRLTRLDCRVIWITRTPVGVEPFACIPDDPLPQRNELFLFANALASNHIKHENFEYRCDVDVAKFKEIAFPNDDLRIGITLTSRSTGISDVIVVDNVFSNCGYRPDMSISRELQVHYCWASEGPMKLAAALLAAKGTAGSGDCLAQTATGPNSLKNPEPNFYIVGMKSYGRGTAFLMRIGYAQVHDIAELLEEDLLKK